MSNSNQSSGQRKTRGKPLQPSSHTTPRGEHYAPGLNGAHAPPPKAADWVREQIEKNMPVGTILAFATTLSAIVWSSAVISAKVEKLEIAMTRLESLELSTNQSAVQTAALVESMERRLARVEDRK